MKPTPNQTALINAIAQEIGWWKQGMVTQKMVEEFVRHELNDLAPDQENQVINSLSKLLHIIKQVE
jgi:hypothetical protein